MKRRILAGIILTGAITGITLNDPTAEARRPIHWKVGEYQKGGFDAQPGDHISVFFQKRDTPVNIIKCDNMGGDGLVLIFWRGRLWEVCWDADF